MSGHFVPRNHSGAPSVDPGVLRRLKILDPDLLVTFWPYSIDPGTHETLEGFGEIDPDSDDDPCVGAIVDPCFHLWRYDRDHNEYFHVNLYPVDEGGFDHPHVAALENDIARFESPRRIMPILQARKDAMNERREKRKREIQADKLKANESRIQDLVFGQRYGRRGGKTYSYSGQRRRQSRAYTERTDVHEGWELPSKSDYEV